MKNRQVLLLTFLFTVQIIFGQSPEITNRSIYSDIKAHNIGDVITVLIVETANASRESKVNNSASSGITAGGSITGNLTSFLPLFGATSSMTNNHVGSEGTQQKEKLTGKISATIVERTESGMFRIRGERLVEVNGENNLMQLEGLVRPRDIKDDNIVYSYNIADAKIIYRKSGLGNKLIKPTRFNRWITWILGVGIIIISLTGALT